MWVSVCCWLIISQLLFTELIFHIQSPTESSQRAPTEAERSPFICNPENWPTSHTRVFLLLISLNSATYILNCYIFSAFHGCRAWFYSSMWLKSEIILFILQIKNEKSSESFWRKVNWVFQEVKKCIKFKFTWSANLSLSSSLYIIIYIGSNGHQVGGRHGLELHNLIAGFYNTLDLYKESK